MTEPPPDSDSVVLGFASRSEDATELLGKAIGDSIEQAAIIALVGDLGAGKTRLARAISVALGVNPSAVSSPTFVLIHEYEGVLPIYHFDAYRLKNASEFLDLGADELMNDNSVCLIEWADRVAQFIPEDRLEIAIAITSTSARKFNIVANGPTSLQLQSRIRDRLPALSEDASNELNL